MKGRPKGSGKKPVQGAPEAVHGTEPEKVDIAPVVVPETPEKTKIEELHDSREWRMNDYGTWERRLK